MPDKPRTSVDARPTCSIVSGYDCSTATDYFRLPSARPPPRVDIASLRSYLRHRQMLIEYAAAHIQHMQKAMTQMNLQLHHVLSDITGMTGMRIIRAIVAGERNREKLAAMRHEQTHADQATIEKV